MADYYKATDAKHFGDRTIPGSKFTDPDLNSLEDVLELAIKQRGNLENDDRAKFIDMGALKDAFDPNIRYLYVETKGLVGIIHSAGRPDGIPLLVRRTKPGAPCSVTYNTNLRHTTDIAVVIIDKDDAGNERLITAHPGTPVKPKTGEFDEFEGQYISLGQARLIAGGELWLETAPIS